MSFVSSRGGATARGTGQFLNYIHQNTPIPPPPTPTAGKLYVIGQNYYGELGVGNTNPVNSLIQVGSANNWLTGSVSYGSTTRYNIMIKSDGTMYGTGDNYYYQLGFGNTTSVSTLTQIGSASNWAWATKGSDQEGAFAITTSGDLYSWGFNTRGSLGQSNIAVSTFTTWSSTQRANITTPTLISSAGNVIQVVTTSTSTAILKNDGTIWTCGYNNQGQLARGINIDTTNVYPSFQQETTYRNDWKYIAASDSKLLAIDNNNIIHMAGRDWQGGNTYYTTLSTGGLPAQPTGGFTSVSYTDSGAWTAITPTNNVYYLGLRTLGTGSSPASVWTDSTLNAYKTQTDGSYTMRISDTSNAYITGSSYNYQFANTIVWQSFDYQGGIYGSLISGMTWMIGN